MQVQVKDKHYDFQKYVGKPRWISYYYQIEEAVNLKKKNSDILVIGIGDGIVIDILKKMHQKVTTLDFDKNLNPDILGSVTELDKLLKKKKFDCIICCQVLEHIPFSEFEKVISDLKNHTKEKLILSLPTRTISWIFKIECTILGERHLRIPMPRFWERQFRLEKEGFGEHYWELNAPHCKTKKVKNIIKKKFTIEKNFTVLENTWHVFFILKPKGVCNED